MKNFNELGRAVSLKASHEINQEKVNSPESQKAMKWFDHLLSERNANWHPLLEHSGSTKRADAAIAEFSLLANKERNEAGEVDLNSWESLLEQEIAKVKGEVAPIQYDEHAKENYIERVVEKIWLNIFNYAVAGLDDLYPDEHGRRQYGVYGLPTLTALKMAMQHVALPEYVVEYIKVKIQYEKGKKGEG